MGRKERDQAEPKVNRQETPCPKEILTAAASGAYPCDQQIEPMLDHLERKK